MVRFAESNFIKHASEKSI